MEARVNPCRPDCPERSATCHVECEAYNVFRHWKEEEYRLRAARAALDEADAARGKKIRRDVHQRGLDGKRRRK